jgi:glycosyltransferase involved in cell wall biosynthesis
MSGRPVKVALVAGSPVYYRAPLYRLVASDVRIELTAIFASSSGVRAGEQGYGRHIAFDVDALSGFESRFLSRAHTNEVGSSSPLSLCDPDIVRELMRGDYDVLWLQGYSTITFALAALTQRLRRRPILLREVQTLLTPRSAPKRLVKRAIFRTLFSGAYGLCAGTQTRRWYEALGLNRSRIFFVPNAVDNDRFQQEARELLPQKQALRRELGIEDDRPVFLMLGRMMAKKQPLFLLDAYRRVRQHVDCALVLAGSGPLDGVIREHVEREDIPDVVLPGFVDQSRVGRLYAAADAFVLPSLYDETWGLVCNEAMNFGLPVVVTDQVGAANDLVRDGVSGFVVPAYDAGPLEGRLRLLALDAVLRSRLGAEGRRRVDAYSHEVAAAGVLDAIGRAVGSSRWRSALPGIVEVAP